MFMSAIALPADADRNTVRSMEWKIAPMRLNRSDLKVLRAELARLHEQLAAQRERVIASREDRTLIPKAEAVAAQNSRQALTMDSYTRLLETLSEGGRRKLVEHIATIKTQMKALGRSQ